MAVGFELEGGVGWVVLDRPEAMNSLDRDTVKAIDAQVGAWAVDPEARVLVVTARGRAFCAGADLMQAGLAQPPGEKDLLDLIVDMFGKLRAFPKPVIAAVNGLALAGGLEIVMCCDIVIASDAAKFGDAHSNFGVFPGGGGAAILPRKIPPNVANYLLFTGDSISAAEARFHGLVNEIVAPDQLEPRARELAARLAKKSPLVLAGMKRVASTTADKSAADALAQELLECRDHGRSWDITEGLAAFREKREPQFKGY